MREDWNTEVEANKLDRLPLCLVDCQCESKAGGKLASAEFKEKSVVLEGVSEIRGMSTISPS